MIRLADRGDLTAIADLMCEFLNETSYTKHTADLIDPEHIRRLVFGVLHQGYIWLYEDDNQLVGLLAAVRENNMWVPSKVSLRELVWYVKPSHRGRSSAGKLFVKYCQQAEALIESNEIDGYFTTRMGTTADYDLEARGFRLTEKLYLKD